jgi:hypothetical protein
VIVIFYALRKMLLGGGVVEVECILKVMDIAQALAPRLSSVVITFEPFDKAVP